MGDPRNMWSLNIGDPYAFFVPAVVFFLYLGFGTIYSTESLGCRVNFPYKVFGLVGHRQKILFHNEDDSRGFPWISWHCSPEVFHAYGWRWWKGCCCFRGALRPAGGRSSTERSHGLSCHELRKKAAKIPAAFLNCCWNSILKRWKLGFETITNLVSPLVPRRRCQQSWRWQIFWLINAKTKWVMLSCTETPRCFQNRPLWHSLIILAFWHFQSSTDFWRCSWSTVKSALSFPMAPAEFCFVS